MEELYSAIFKRRSMRKYDDALSLTAAQLEAMRDFARQLAPLDAGIRTACEFAPRADTTAKFGEYCALFFSEDKPGAALNTGYMLEQLDLYLAAHDIGACWYGLARPKKEMPGGLLFHILLAFGQSRPEDFRDGAADFSRRPREDVWTGAFDSDVVEAVRVSPSACNCQPWRYSSGGGRVEVLRETALRTFIPPSRRAFFNSIDVGISLFHFECACAHKGIRFERTLCEPHRRGSLVETAVYKIG
ncbi:MAG: nitroreductase family protein [Oscillospiraceae bacterium]|nr:nitroreductase family protein [Oscillospiraceae bacterium]